MTVRSFFAGSLITAIFSWTIWIAIILFLDPARVDTLGYLLFFLTLFLSVASTSGLVGYFVRRIITPRQLSAYTVRVALRQGLLLGLFLDILLLLQLTKLYRWWLVVIVIVLSLVIELIFLSSDRASNQRSSKNYD